MTTISATSLSSYYAGVSAAAKKAIADATSGSTTGSGGSAATNVTLSDAAKAALNQKDFATVIAETRAALDKLLAGGTDPADANLSSLDRRQLFAVTSSTDGTFSAGEQAAARTESANRRDAALAGPLAVARVTDDIENMYVAALAYLDGASTEEKGTATWITQHDALLKAQSQLAADPQKTPVVDGDIVADYIRRATAGETGTTRAFADVATDARAALDAQYASATAAGSKLVFSAARVMGQLVDFSKFDNRSLSAVALNQGEQFSAEEVQAARTEMRSRSTATVLSTLNSATGSDPTAFAKSLLSAYASMSSEERSAAGWTDKLYAAAVSSYKTTSQLTSLLGGSSGGTGSASAFSLLGGSDQSGTAMSLADYLKTAG